MRTDGQREGAWRFFDVRDGVLLLDGKVGSPWDGPVAACTIASIVLRIYGVLDTSTDFQKSGFTSFRHSLQRSSSVKSLIRFPKPSNGVILGSEYRN